MALPNAETPENWGPKYNDVITQEHDVDGRHTDITADDIITKGPWFDVRAYGADSTGASDSTTAIQAALDAAKLTGGVVKVPIGLFVCSGQVGLDAPNGVTLEGTVSNTQNVNSSIIRYTGTEATFLSISNSVNPAASLIIKNIRFEYTNGSFTGTLVTVFATPIVIEDCVFQGNGVTSADVLLHLKGDIATVSRCFFEGADYGISGESSIADTGVNAVSIKNCTFNPVDIAHILNPGDGWDVSACAFENLTDGTGKAIILETNKTASGMSFRGNWLGDASDNSAWSWVDIRGNGWNISGNFFNGEGNLASTAIKVVGATVGLTITGNQFRSFNIGVDLGIDLATGVCIMGNSYIGGAGVTTRVDVSGNTGGFTGIIQSPHGNVCLDIYSTSQVTPLMRITESTGGVVWGGDLQAVNIIAASSFIGGVDGAERGFGILWDGTGGNKAAYITLHSRNGSKWTLFVEDDGTLKILENNIPVNNADGAAVGAQTD